MVAQFVLIQKMFLFCKVLCSDPYLALKYGGIPFTQSKMQSHMLMAVNIVTSDLRPGPGHVPGRAGGGWEEEESADGRDDVSVGSDVAAAIDDTDEAPARSVTPE